MGHVIGVTTGDSIRERASIGRVLAIPAPDRTSHQEWGDQVHALQSHVLGHVPAPGRLSGARQRTLWRARSREALSPGPPFRETGTGWVHPAADNRMSHVISEIGVAAGGSVNTRTGHKRSRPPGVREGREDKGGGCVVKASLGCVPGTWPPQTPSAQGAKEAMPPQPGYAVHGTTIYVRYGAH